MNAARKTVLIVDDEPDIVLVLATTLEDAGYAVVEVERGDDLERALASGDMPDVIVLDMLLSGRDGREIARQLKKHEATRSIPILMLSAHPSAAREALAAGADDFLAKPFDLDVLLEKVAGCLR